MERRGFLQSVMGSTALWGLISHEVPKPQPPTGSIYKKATEIKGLRCDSKMYAIYKDGKKERAREVVKIYTPMGMKDISKGLYELGEEISLNHPVFSLR